MRTPLIERFEESLRVDAGRWRDGDGYALDLLADATPAERDWIEGLILSREPRDWRDIEALARIDPASARDRLRQVWNEGDPALRLAIAHHAPTIPDETELADLLVSALRGSPLEGGHVTAMLLVETFHPPPVIEALFEAAATREAVIAYDCAAMVLYLHGLIDSPHDFAERPFLLRFVEDERGQAVADLRERIAGREPIP